MSYSMSLALLAGVGLGFTAFNLPPALDVLMSLFGLSYAGMALLLSAAQWTHAAMQIPGGVIADKLSLKKILTLGLGLIVLGQFSPALAPDLVLAITGRVIVGVGSGLTLNATMKLIALYAPQGRSGTYQGYFGAALAFGSILAFLILPKLSSQSWRWPFLAAGLLVLAAWAMVAALKLKALPADSMPALPLKRILSIKTIWVIGFYHALSWGAMLNLGNWVPSVLAEVWARPLAAEFAWGGVLILLLSGLARWAGGAALSLIGATRLVNWAIFILFLSFLGLFLCSSPWLVLALMLVVAWFSSVTFSAFLEIAGQVAAANSLATVFGFFNLLGNLGVVLFTPMFGLIKDSSGSFRGGFAILSALALASLVFGGQVLRPDQKSRNWP